MDDDGDRARINHLLTAERWRVAELADLYSLRGVDYATPVYPDWSAKDVLGHVVYWHESFARNIEALATGRDPSPPTGSLRQTNEISVARTRNVSKAALLRRMRAAQVTIEAHVHDESIRLIPYRRGSRPYGRAEHLEVVAGHIRAHHWDVVRAMVTGTVV